MSVVVWAAGGVLWRPAERASEVVLVHRPRYDDWSLPKGKLTKGEHPIACAVREVFEETAVHGVPQYRLPSTRYLTGQPGVEKAVEYWSMRSVAEDAFTPGDEVDDVRWFPVPEAGRRLTYGHDRGVLTVFADRPQVTGQVLLIRHTSAGERDKWSGPDGERPLDGAGSPDAEALCALLSLFRPSRVISATPLRCRQTVAPLSAALGLPIEPDPRFDESAEPREAASAMRALAASGVTAVVCSQRGIIPPVVAELNGAADPGKYATAKGDGWTLAFAGTALVAADRVELHPRRDS